MGRGPSYPYVDLEQAISLAQKMYDYAKRAPAPLDSVVSDAWKYSASSSSGQKVLAALKAYGLIEDAPGTNGKAIKLTPRSVRILLDDTDSEERRLEIRRAALSPKWYEFCWKTWGKEMPNSMKSVLLIEHGFVGSTVEGFLKDYKKTIAFAGLLDDADNSKSPESSGQSGPSVGIGDYVQWESQGMLRMASARKLTHFSPDGGFGFVEGSATGIPVGQLVPAEPPEMPEREAAANSPAKKSIGILGGGATMLQETFSLPDGTSVIIQWPAAFTPEAFEDFSDWLNLVKKKIKRTVPEVAPGEARQDGEGAVG